MNRLRKVFALDLITVAVGIIFCIKVVKVVSLE